jgi:hypothetical protein
VAETDANSELRSRLAAVLDPRCIVSSGPVMPDLMWDQGITASDWRSAGFSVRVENAASTRLVVLMLVRGELRFWATTDKDPRATYFIAGRGVLASFDAAVQLCTEFVAHNLPVEHLTTKLHDLHDASDARAEPVHELAIRRYACPCCKFLTFVEEPPGTLAICPVCSWQDCPVQSRRPDYEGGFNDVSLHQARAFFAKLGACSPQFVSGVRPPQPEELPRSIELDPDQVLVLYEWIRRIDSTGQLIVDDAAEHEVLSHVHAQLDRIVTAQFIPDYADAVARAWARIRERSGE